MAEKITGRVPIFAKCYKDEWKHAETMRRNFVSDYPIKRIPKLSLDEYVIGKGADNQSFCYRLEREMDSLGRILGATAFKFGVYYGRTKSDSTEKYRFVPHWGSTADKAFASVKNAIVELLKAADAGDADAIADNPISPMFKGKLLFLYHPDKFAPIYSEEHLHHFIACLNLPGTFDCGADMQRALMEYRATWPQLMSHHPALYMRFLYDVFDYPPDLETPDKSLINVPVLGEALDGAEFISEMPASAPQAQHKSAGGGKPDYEKREGQLKRIGDPGEAIVIDLERKRLKHAGKSKLASQIKHVSDEDDGAGFDVLSFDEDGTERRIEVKATTAGNLDRGFYISSNELEKASSLKNYYLYLVFSTMSKKPRVLPMKRPTLKGGAFVLRPVTYHATVSGQ